MRLMSAAPRGVIANRRSSVTAVGLRLVIVSRAFSASPSLNSRISPSALPMRSFSGGRRSTCPMTTQHDSGTRQYNRAAMEQPPYRDVTVGNLLTKLARRLPDHEALVYAEGPRYTFAALER